MAIENTVSIDFDPRSSIVHNVFDCRLPGVDLSHSIPVKINAKVGRYTSNVLRSLRGRSQKHVTLSA